MEEDKLILFVHAALNVGAGALILVVILTVVIPSWRRYVQKVHHRIRTFSGGAWVLTRLVTAALITGALANYKELLLTTFPSLAKWVGNDLLAFLAIIFAIVQFLDARDEEKDMRKIEHHVTEMVGQISTRGIRPFPENLDDIIVMLRGAKNSVRVMVDFPGYGQYSAPERHKEYQAALNEAAQRPAVKFQLVSYDDVLTTEESKAELKAPIPPTRKEDKEKFEAYLKANGISQASAPNNFAELHALLRKHQEQSLVELTAAVKHPEGLERRYLSERVPIFLWLVDNREAVFTFKNLERNEDAASIRTTDGSLIKNLAFYFDFTFDAASQSFARMPSYKLTNLEKPLTDGATVTITGQVHQGDGALVVQTVG